MNRLIKILLSFLLVLSFTSTSYSRDQIKIVGSSTVYPYATVVAEKFGKSGKFKTRSRRDFHIKRKKCKVKLQCCVKQGDTKSLC